MGLNHIWGYQCLLVNFTIFLHNLSAGLCMYCQLLLKNIRNSQTVTRDKGWFQITHKCSAAVNITKSIFGLVKHTSWCDTSHVSRCTKNPKATWMGLRIRLNAPHYIGVIMSAMVSQITCVLIVCSTGYSGADQREHQSSASPRAFVGGIHRWPVDSPHKGPVTRKMFPFDDVIIHQRAHPNGI